MAITEIQQFGEYTVIKEAVRKDSSYRKYHLVECSCGKRNRELGGNENLIYGRVRNGWNLNKAFNTPLLK